MNLLLVLLFGIGAATITLVRFYCAKAKVVKEENSSKYARVRARLTAYERMKNCRESDTCSSVESSVSEANCCLLSPNQHDILLGILKKIEAKFTAFAVVIIFAFSITTNLMPEALGQNKLSMPPFAAAVGIMVAMIWASLEGANHLGQRHFVNLALKDDECSEIRELQRSLIHDMLKKESMYDQYFQLAKVVIALLVFSLTTHAIAIYLELICKG